MPLNPLNSSNLEELALKGLTLVTAIGQLWFTRGSGQLVACVRNTTPMTSSTVVEAEIRRCCRGRRLVS